MFFIFEDLLGMSLYPVQLAQVLRLINNQQHLYG